MRKLIRPKPCLTAVDIGTQEIKLIELKLSNGVPLIHKYASMATPPLREGKLAEEETAQALTRLTDLAGISSREVITAISGAKVITRQMKLPPMEDGALEETVKSEVSKYIPLPVEDLTLRYVKLGLEKGEAEDQLNIMLIAVPTALVEQYYHIFFMAGLTLKAIDLQAFGLWRLFGRTESTRTLAVLDIGSTYSQVLVMKEGKIKFLRGITIGSQAFIQEIAFLNHPEAPGGMHNLALELKRSLDYYCSQRGEETIQRVILTGGGSKLNGVEQYLSRICSVPSQIEIPAHWRSYDQDSEQNTPYDPSYAVSLGLALREVI
ncbi:type IV pilus biogenesis protein PilM [Desulfotomaculum defluvii]